MEQGAAEFGEAEVAPAGNQVVGEADDFLILPFVADFRAAEDDFQCRTGRLELADNFGRLPDIPDVDAEADDLRGAARLAQFSQQRRDDFLNRPLDGEFAQHADGAQVLTAMAGQVGKQVAQAKRSVDVFGVEGTKDDGGRRHAAILTASPMH